MTRKQKARIWNRYAVPAIETAAAATVIIIWFIMAAGAERFADLILNF
jgi:hypothetical protein